MIYREKIYINMSKKIRLTEADLHRIVKESVNNILIEGNGRVSVFFCANCYVIAF